VPVNVSRTTLLVVGCALLAVLVLAGNRLAKTGTASAPDVAAELGSGTVASGAPIEPGAAAADSGKLVVDVVGAVRRPGLYDLREGQRAADAVARAGGSTRKADLAAINLAAPLVDGTQILVPSRVSGATSGTALPTGSGGAIASTSSAHSVKVSLSTATVEQLDALPGVGPVTAQKIVDYRTENGPFASVDDLDAVPGIGPARIENLRDLVTP